MIDFSFRRLARASLILAVTTAGVLWSATAVAQVQMYPGEDVTVNPSAIPQSDSGRNLPPVHLHPARPAHHTRKQHKRAVPAAKKPRTTRRHAVKPGHRNLRKPVPTKAKAVPEKAEPIPFSFAPPHPTVPQPTGSSRQLPPLPAAAPLHHVQLPKGLSKQASVLFDTRSFAISDTTSATLNDLSFSLKTALASGADRVELVGYGGKPGDTSSAARRLSLERALAVRQALISDGVPAERIDVRALGGVPASDHGATDRVDIFVKN